MGRFFLSSVKGRAAAATQGIDSTLGVMMVRHERRPHPSNKRYFTMRDKGRRILV